MRVGVVRRSLVAAICLISWFVVSLPINAEKRDGKTQAAGNTASLVWPLPPEQPRIRYLRSYQSADDFTGKKKPSKFALALLGPKDTGAAADSLVKPYGVAASRTGKLFVADTASRRAFAFDPDLKTLSFIGDGGPGKLTKPVGVAVDDRDVVFVADATLKRVFGYAPDGTLQIAIGHEGELSNPSGLAIDRVNHRLYVADASKHQILCYSTLDGAAQLTIGKRGSENGEFNFPTNLAVDGRGRLYVADTLNFRIQIFDANGTFLRTFGELGDTPGSLNRPKGVSVDSEGHVYVVDASFNNFQIFNEEGQLLLFVGAGGRNPGEFVLPAGMFIDEQDRIYIADQGNSRVQVFQYLHGAVK